MPSEDEKLTPQQVQATFQQIEKQCSALINKIAELEQEVNEHNLVLKAFEKVEPTRRCFRMVGGVLVERTVVDVSPAVKDNQEKVKKLVQQLQEQLAKNTAERSKFMEKYGLNERGRNEQASDAQANRPAGGSVLV
mmetsp:Transcript_6296/g.17677  ORF Transcript_6296/g.17677 Transcript_6296/m.17677 type:complete len:136 (+) Transcript_6296:82-489(+)